MCNRQSKAAPDETSIIESSPNPTSAILPAIKPAPIAITASSEFHPIVMYSSQRPRRTLSLRVISWFRALVLTAIMILLFEVLYTCA